MPGRSNFGVARTLVTRANAARDAGRYLLAAGLYEEALHFTPASLRIRIQCGHMFKEAGDFATAERHYLQASALAPDDPDLALQLGHFYKVSGRPDEAEAAYRHALALNPGWREAAEELARVRSSVEASDPALVDSPGDDIALLAPELLPAGSVAAEGTLREGVYVRRLGTSRQRSREGYQRALRGIEAIRGFCISSTPLTELLILLDGETIHREPLQAAALEGDGGVHAKYVFNIWYDFSHFDIGPRLIELRGVDRWGRGRTHRARVLVAAPLHKSRYADSDALVDGPADDRHSVEDWVNTRPSMVRPARRSLLPRPPRSILIQRAEQLGDLVCSVPAMRRLREMFPDARLVALVTPANAALARTLDMLDDIVIADFFEDEREARRTMPLRAQQELRRKLEPYAFDVAIDLGEGAGSRPLLLLSGAPFLYGFKDREFPWLSAGFELNGRDPVNGLEVVPPSRKLVALVEGLGAMLDGDAEAIRRPDLELSALAPFGLSAAGRFVVLHTGARLAFSRWPHFSALAKLILERTELKVVVIADEDAFAATDGPGERLRVLTGKLPFETFDALASFAAAFVGNDSGPKHLAALRGTPVVSIHMARHNWNEWGQEIGGSIVSRRVPCAGCGIHRHPEECGKEFACLNHILPEEVFAAVTDLL